MLNKFEKMLAVCFRELSELLHSNGASESLGTIEKTFDLSLGIRFLSLWRIYCSTKNSIGLCIEVSRNLLLL